MKNKIGTIVLVLVGLIVMGATAGSFFYFEFEVTPIHQISLSFAMGALFLFFIVFIASRFFEKTPSKRFLKKALRGMLFLYCLITVGGGIATHFFFMDFFYPTGPDAIGEPIVMGFVLTQVTAALFFATISVAILSYSYRLEELETPAAPAVPPVPARPMQQAQPIQQVQPVPPAPPAAPPAPGVAPVAPPPQFPTPPGAGTPPPPPPPVG